MFLCVTRKYAYFSLMGAAGLQMPVGWQARALAPTFNFRLHSAKKKGLAQQEVEDIIDIFYTTKRWGAWRERECIRKCKEKLVRKFSFLNDIKFVILIKLNGTVQMMQRHGLSCIHRICEKCNQLIEAPSWEWETLLRTHDTYIETPKCVIDSI